jgi:Tfp pilus assembly protein PilV
MPLGLAVLLLVLGVTALLGLLGYLIDKSEAAQEQNTRKVTERK